MRGTLKVKKTRLTILLAIALVIASSISTFACTYSVSVYHDNTATSYYYKDGTISTTFSWDNSNYHPNLYYQESRYGYTHSGTLTSYATSTGNTQTFVSSDPSTDWYQYTTKTYTTLYEGDITNSQCGWI
ncbi:hypothetical protein P0092_04375 [Ruminiclostridium papyrosolvens DSM 2782]|uniref:hypothetical protein n=1 Tax=Ruminiclostridium papyrosolvens TaxID=29362 RepID=UPI0023E39103|nr:hypothetical protein [Ruminiclostridium papyrosolvens]WES35224.1 hypothetical protein P0092_04375 [Ruminiclostridium papyrosolvens DSM 2782]